MANFLELLRQNPYQPIDSASVTRVDELGNGYDDFGQLIAPKFEQAEQTWGETALGVATAPARLATALAGSLSPYGSEGWQIPPIVSEGADALTAVGDAYTKGMDQDEINRRSLGMASMMFAGGGAFARPAMAESARNAVAPKTYRMYHGTASPDDFDTLQAFGSKSRGDPFGKALYMSDSPELASRHAAGDKGRVFPVDVDGPLATLDDYNAALVNNGYDMDATAENLMSMGYNGVYAPSSENGMSSVIGSAVFRPGTVRSATTGEVLFSNADSRPGLLAGALDMSQEARLARAKELGFDTSKTWYHGTDKEFDKFDLGYAGSGGNAGNAERAAFFTDNPSVADSYLGKQYINAASPNAEKFVGSVNDGVKTVYGEGSRVLPVMVKGSDGLEVWDMGGGAYTPEFMKRALREAREANATGVMFENMRDPGLSSLGRPKASNVMAVFDPRNIRSVNAAFDPSKSDSANLLAANADSRPALLAGALAEERPSTWPTSLPDGVRLERSGDSNYLAYAGDTPIAQGYVRDLGDNIQMGNVSVFDPAWQRQGIGSAMFGTAERDFGKPHVPDVNLSDAAYNLWLKTDPDAVANYQRMPWGQWMPAP